MRQCPGCKECCGKRRVHDRLDRLDKAPNASCMQRPRCRECCGHELFVVLRAAGASMVQKLLAVQENTGGSQGVSGPRSNALHAAAPKVQRMLWPRALLFSACRRCLDGPEGPSGPGERLRATRCVWPKECCFAHISAQGAENDVATRKCMTVGTDLTSHPMQFARSSAQGVENAVATSTKSCCVPQVPRWSRSSKRCRRTPAGHKECVAPGPLLCIYSSASKVQKMSA